MNPRFEFVCPVPWSAMEGTSQARACEQCGHLVRNLSTLSEPERAALLERARNERVCAALYLRREAGTFAPVFDFAPADAGRAKQVGVAALSAATLALVSGCLNQPATPADARVPATVSASAVTQAAPTDDEEIVLMLGFICPPPATTVRHGPPAR